jgi:hypothetical protein
VGRDFLLAKAGPEHWDAQQAAWARRQMQQLQDE